MVWKTLGDSLEAALASMLIDGDEVAGTRLDADKLAKSAGAEAPASWCQGDTALPVQEDDASRWEYAAMTRDAPSPAAYCHLVVDNGGGPARGGGGSGAAYRIKPSGERASEFLRLVV